MFNKSVTILLFALLTLACGSDVRPMPYIANVYVSGLDGTIHFQRNGVIGTPMRFTKDGKYRLASYCNAKLATTTECRLNGFSLFEKPGHQECTIGEFWDSSLYPFPEYKVYVDCYDTVIPDLVFADFNLAGLVQGAAQANGLTQVAEISGIANNIHPMSPLQIWVPTLEGIEQLTGLTALTITDAGIENTDLSQNLLLEHIDLRHNKLTVLDLTANNVLQSLLLSGNEGLSTLNITAVDNPLLDELQAKSTVLDSVWLESLKSENSGWISVVNY